MFRYIFLPRLVAYYLREFSYYPTRATWEGSTLYSFVMCLCLPFISQTFRRARLYALMIAECTNSADQIKRVLNKITGAVLTDDTTFNAPCMIAYNIDSAVQVPYVLSKKTIIPYSAAVNQTVLHVKLNQATKEEVEAYLSLLIPFYVQYTIIYE